MGWSGWPTTEVSQLTFTEWDLVVRPGREVLVGYTLSDLGVWHVFGGDNWVWFNGVIRGSSGAIESVRQWAEAENLFVSHRHWRWVHWRNPSSETVYASPRFVLAPPLADRALRAAGQASRTKRLWTITDVATTEILGFGHLVPAPGDGSGDGGRGDERGDRDGERQGEQHGDRQGGRPDNGHAIVPDIAVRPLEGQRLDVIELRGDDRFLPLEELDARIDRIRKDYGGYGEQR
jgi:hypothetical protein